MTDRQKSFADEYLIDCNATRAYKVAYPSIKKDETAAQAGSRMLRNVKVKTYIDERLKAISNDKIATATEVMEFMSAVMRGSLKEIDKAVVEGEVVTLENEPRIREKLKAAELLGKRFGLDKAEEDNSELRKLDEVLEKIKGVI